LDPTRGPTITRSIQARVDVISIECFEQSSDSNVVEASNLRAVPTPSRVRFQSHRSCLNAMIHLLKDPSKEVQKTNWTSLHPSSDAAAAMHGSVMQLLDTRRSCSGGRSSTHEMNYVFPASHLPIASLVMSKLELGSVLLQVANNGFGQGQMFPLQIAYTCPAWIPFRGEHPSLFCFLTVCRILQMFIAP